DEAQSDAAGSDAADHLRLDAADLHLHARRLPGRPRDLLGVEQPAVRAAAELHHAPQWREGGVVRQSQVDLRVEEGRVEDVTATAFVIARSEATKQSMSPRAARWIASRSLSSGRASRGPVGSQ